MKTAKDLALTQEFDAYGAHRLARSGVPITAWAEYKGWVYWHTEENGERLEFVGVTDYFTGTEEAIVTPHEFFTMTSPKIL